MYAPVQDGIEKTIKSVLYTEAKPPTELAGLVHCYWQIKTTLKLTEDFKLHAVPDACVDIMFNQVNTKIAGVTALRTTYEVLNLGRDFHYIGIQFFPGVWRGNRHEIADKYIGTSYKGSLPLIEMNKKMAGLGFNQQQPFLTQLVLRLAEEKIVVANKVTAKILAQLDGIHTVSDMANITRMSPRQLQRTLKQATGFSPRDFLKVLRLQQAIKQGYPLLYTDQSHFIHSFKAITGYTPAQYYRKFNV